MLTIHDRNIDYIEIKHLEKLTCVCGTPVYLKGVFKVNFRYIYKNILGSPLGRTHSLS